MLVESKNVLLTVMDEKLGSHNIAACLQIVKVPAPSNIISKVRHNLAEILLQFINLYYASKQM